MPPRRVSGERILVAGVPRSGTTWIARMLASCDDTALVFEPDNPQDHPYALHKRKLPGGYYTALSPTDHAPALERLWRDAFSPPRTGPGALDELRRRAARRLFRGAKPHAPAAFRSRPRLSLTLRLAEALAVPARPTAGPNVIVKTVYAARSLEWIADRVDAQVVVVRRDLRSVVSSWIEIWGLGADDETELEVADPADLERVASRLGICSPPAEPLERTTWLLAVLDRLMVEAATRNPEWVMVRYEDLLDDPVDSFRSLARRLGLPWTPGSDELVRASNRPGTGYDTHRVNTEARDVWRHRLTPQQQGRVSSVLAAVDAGG
jgi:hypothetical protein